MAVINPFTIAIARQGIKKGLGAFGKYVGRKKAKAKVKTEALKKTKLGEKGLGAFQKTKDFASGKGLSGSGKFIPVRQGVGYSGVRGARDIAQMGVGASIPLEGIRSAAPLFTDEDMTAQNYAGILAAALGAGPSLRMGRAALQRQAPGVGKLLGGRRGEKFKTRYTTDKKGKKVPMKDDFGRVVKDKYQLDMDPKTARQDITRQVGAFGIMGATPFVFGGDNEKVTEYPDTLPGEAEKEAEYNKLTTELSGPKEKEAIELIQKRQGTKAEYSEQQAKDIILQAREQDEANKVKGPEEGQVPDEQAEEQATVSGDEQPPVSDSKLPPEAPGTGADNETNLEINSEQAIEDADNTAKNITNPEITKPNIVDSKSPSDVFLAADVKERDYKGMESAMSKYSDFIKSEEGKTLNYKEYIKRFKDMTGDDDQAGNIALFKWAMGMMTGRSNQNGLAGFMDIAGTAGLSLGEDLMAINERTREENRALAGSFLAYEQDAQKYLSGLRQTELQQLLGFEEKVLNDTIADEDRVFDRQLQRQQIYLQKMQIMKEIQDRKQDMMKAGKLQTVIMSDDGSRFGVRKVELGRNENGNLLVIDEFVDGVPTNRTITEEEQAMIVDNIDVDPVRSGKLYNRLEAINTGLKFTKTVRDIVSSQSGVDLGSRGYFDNVFSNITGLYNDWSNGSDVGLGGKLNNASDDQQVRALINETYLDMEGLTGKERSNAQKEYDRLVSGWNKDKQRSSAQANDIMNKGLDSKYVPRAIRNKFKGKSVADRQKIIRQLAELRLIENRMKYIVANANKGEDRLTVADVKDAAQNTNIFGLWDSESKVAANYAALDEQLNTSYNSLSKAYISVGGNSKQLDEHKNTESYINWQTQKNNKNQPKQKADVDTLIDRIYKARQ